MHAADVVRLVPDGLHAVDVAFFEGGVELRVGGDNRLEISGHRDAFSASRRAMTRTASALARTACTRTAQTRARAATTVSAAVASSRASTGRGASSPRR